MNLFIFNFKNKKVKFFLWLFLWFLLFEVIAYFLVFIFNDYKIVKKISKPINIGFSVESKLRKQVENEEENPGSILKHYWVNKESWVGEPKEGSPLVSFYGMSFTSELAEKFRSISKINSNTETRIVFAPVAPVSHSYASFLLDIKDVKPDFAVLSVLENTLHYLLSMTMSGRNLVADYEYNYPLYKISNTGDLVDINPIVSSFDQFISMFNAEKNWELQLEQFKKYEYDYSDFIYKKSILDYYVFFRLIRVWKIKRNIRKLESLVYDHKGNLLESSEALNVLIKILNNFKKISKENNIKPILFLISNKSSNNLYRLIKDDLAEDIYVLNSEDYCSFDNRSNFKSDGHFIEKCNEIMAQKLYEYIKK